MVLSKWYFSFDTVRKIYRANTLANVDYMEIGYKASTGVFCPSDYGPWRFCFEDDLKRAAYGLESDTKLAVMMDAHKSTIDDIKPKEQSVVDIIRVATYVKDADTAIKTANAANENGYDATINIMAISHAVDWELEEALAQIQEETKVIAVYIVDSFGALYSEDIDFYYDKYKKHIKDKEIGVHCHNHQQLGFANTIQGIIRGANYVDGTLYGVGRAAGNCPLELLMSFLKNPKFDIRPILDVIGKHIIPLQKEIEWGYNIPYMIAGILNLHPRDSMELLSLDKDDPKRSDFRAFYEKCLELI